jgi:hypothetical protein
MIGARNASSCQAVSAKALLFEKIAGMGVQIVSAGIVSGQALRSRAFKTARDLPVSLPSGRLTLRVTTKGKKLLVEVYDPKNLAEAVDTVTATTLNTGVCKGRGVLHLVDDIIVPPSLMATLQAASVPGKFQECPVGDDADGGSKEGDLPTATAVTAGVDMTLQTPTTTAKTNVEAAVNTTAVDSKGNKVPVDETIILGVDASLEEIAAAGANLINVRTSPLCLLHISCLPAHFCWQWRLIVGSLCIVRSKSYAMQLQPTWV